MDVSSCRDIFNAVYVNVRGSFISSRYTANVKSKTVTEGRAVKAAAHADIFRIEQSADALGHSACEIEG